MILKTIADGCKTHFNLHPIGECPDISECRDIPDRKSDSGTKGDDTPSAHWAWSPLQWLALAAGVTSRMWLDEGNFDLGRLAVAAITATMIFPAVYRKTMADSESHFLKLCVTRGGARLQVPDRRRRLKPINVSSPLACQNPCV